MVTIHNVLQGTEEWKQLRHDLYTGSNADKLLKFYNSMKIVDGVATYYALTEITSFRGNFYTDRGHELEDEALELYGLITGHTVGRPGFITNTDFPGWGFSPDGEDENMLLNLEVKAFNMKKHLEMLRGNIPIKVEAQNHFGQAISEKKGSRLIIYNPDFAKEELDGLPNTMYDPSKAIKIIDVPFNKLINNNFKRIAQIQRERVAI